jgi:hypothetical protein
VVFSSCFSIRKVIKSNFIYHFVGWDISVFTQKFSIIFWCFAAYISKVLLADITGQRHIFEGFAA